MVLLLSFYSSKERRKQEYDQKYYVFVVHLQISNYKKVIYSNYLLESVAIQRKLISQINDLENSLADLDENFVILNLVYIQNHETQHFWSDQNYQSLDVSYLKEEEGLEMKILLTFIHLTFGLNIVFIIRILLFQGLDFYYLYSLKYYQHSNMAVQAGDHEM